MTKVLVLAPSLFALPAIQIYYRLIGPLMGDRLAFSHGPATGDEVGGVGHSHIIGMPM